MIEWVMEWMNEWGMNAGLLSRDLDHEQEQEHEVILTLTDGNLGQENYITQEHHHPSPLP